jgi:hypothetical protein
MLAWREDRRHTVSVFNGPVPQIRRFAAQAEESEAIGAWLRALVADGVQPHDAADGIVQHERSVVAVALATTRRALRNHPHFDVFQCPENPSRDPWNPANVFPDHTNDRMIAFDHKEHSVYLVYAGLRHEGSLAEAWFDEMEHRFECGGGLLLH